MGKCQKVPKFEFQNQFSISKFIWIFLNLATNGQNMVIFRQIALFLYFFVFLASCSRAHFGRGFFDIRFAESVRTSEVIFRFFQVVQVDPSGLLLSSFPGRPIGSKIAVFFSKKCKFYKFFIKFVLTVTINWQYIPSLHYSLNLNRPFSK